MPVLKLRAQVRSILYNLDINVRHISDDTQKYKEVDSLPVKNKDPTSSSARCQVCLCYPDGLVWPISASVLSEKLGGES